MFTDLGFSDQKMYFLFKRSFTIFNDGASLTVVNERSFLNNRFLFKTIDRFLKRLFLKSNIFKKRNGRFSKKLKTIHPRFTVKKISISGCKLVYT